MKKQFYLTMITFLTTLLAAKAQVPDVPMADEMRANGKIYVVVTVMAILFLGMLIYLLLLDKKIAKIEKKMRENRD